MRVETVCMVGGTGFVGRSVADRLCTDGVRVRVITRHPLGARALWVLPTLENVVANPHDEVVLAKQFEGMDAVINLVGILHPSRGQGFDAVHEDLPRKVVGACRAAGVRHLVHMSALGASESGPSEYLRSKARGERAVREGAGTLPFTILRPSVIFGADDRFLNTFAALVRLFPVIPLAGADARFQPIWVEDVARVITTVLGDSRTYGRTFELCGPKVYTLRELVATVGAITRRRRAIIGLPGWAGFLQALVLEHLPGRMMTRDNLRSMSVANVCDSPFEALFGFEPAALENVVPRYLGAASRHRYDFFRFRAGR